MAKLRFRIDRPPPPMIVALVALFIALGGSSYAAITLSKNSVKSEHIAKGQVKRSDIAKKAINSRKVADSSLLAKDFKAGQLPAGPKGDTGPQGLQGPQGPAGATNVEVRSSGLISSTAVPPDEEATAAASCGLGMRAVGGGHRYRAGDRRDFVVIDSQPEPRGGDPPRSWIVTVFNADHNNDDAGEVRFNADVVCAAP